MQIKVANWCKLAALAYQGPEIATPKLQGEFPGRQIQFISDGFLVAKEPQLVVSLKGIGNLEEYASKKRIFDDNALIPAPGAIPGRIHSGLRWAVEPLFQNLVLKVSDHPQLVVVGHSLGGGIGTLLGALFANQGCKVQIYTFGSPKVGDHPFVRWLEQAASCSSIKVEGDPIPSWPIASEYAEVTHAAFTLQGVRTRQFIKLPGGIEDISAVELQAHSIFSYVLATNQAAKRSG